MKLRLVVSILLILAVLLTASHAHAQAAPEKSKIICDHAAPPRGMHYVCKSQCDCHLEGKLKNNEDGALPATSISGDSCEQVITSLVPPVYPPIARTNVIGGTVFVQVEVDDNGAVKSASVIEGHPMLRQAALESVRQWRFNPKCNHVQMIDIRFRLVKNKKSEPSGLTINPPYEIEVTAAPFKMGISVAVVPQKKAIPQPRK